MPFCTISAAAAVVEPGQTVHVADGTYREAVRLTRSGTPDAPITFVGVDPDVMYNGRASVIDGSDHPHALELSGVHDVSVQKLHLTHSQQDALLVADSTQVTVDRLNSGQRDESMTPPPNPNPAVRITGGSSDVTVSRSYLADYERGVVIDPGVKRAVITTNDIRVHGDAVSATDAPGTVVTGNSISLGCESGIALGGASSGSTVENNAFAEGWFGECATHPGDLLVSTASAPGTKVDYNDADQNSTAPYNWAGESYLTVPAFQAASGQGAHELTSASGGSDGYQEGVPEIDSADANAPGELTTDLNGNSRVDDPLVANTGTGVGYHDRGAYEHQESLRPYVQVDMPSDGDSPLDRQVTVTMPTNPGNPRPWGTPEIVVDFGDGTRQTASDSKARHTYAKEGTYPITVTVTGVSGRTVTTTTSATVYSDPIHPVLKVNQTFIGNNPHTYELDPFSTVTRWPTASRRFDYGDGTPETGIRQHEYLTAGTHTVTMTVTDTKGNTAKTTAVVTDGMAYVGVTPARVLDTRNGTGGHKGSVGPGEVIKIAAPRELAGERGAVVLNLTATGPTAGGFVTAYPTGIDRPTVSSLNFTAGQTVANQVVVPVNVDGTILLYNHSGNVQLVADLVGFYAFDYQNHTADHQGVTAPTRALDTRAGLGVPAAGKVGPGGIVDFKVTGLGGVPDNAHDVVLNLTATDPTENGYVTADPDAYPPSHSNLNFSAGQTVANQIIAKVDRLGHVRLYNFRGDVHLIADIQGFHGGTGADKVFIPTTPTRLLDTRTGTGGVSAPIGADRSVKLKVSGSAGIPDGVRTVLVNLTATNPTANGFLTAYAAGATRPNTSIVNFTPGATVPNLAYVPVSADGYIEIYNRSGSTDAIVDVQGYLGSVSYTHLGLDQGQVEPDHLAHALGPRAPAQGEPADQLQAASALVRLGRVAFAGRVGEGVGDLDQQGVAEGQPDADGGAGVPDGVGDEFADQQFGGVGEVFGPPLDERAPDQAAGPRDGGGLGGQRPPGRRDARLPTPEPGQQQRDVIGLAPLLHGGEHRLAGLLDRRVRLLQDAQQPAEADVEVLVPGLHQPVRAEGQQAALGDVELDRLERHAADPERRTRGQVQDLADPARQRAADGGRLPHRVLGDDQDRWDVARLGRRELAGGRVEDDVHAGGEQRLVRALGQVVGQVVDVPEQDVRRQVEPGQGADGGAQPSHRRGGPQTVTHHVTHHQGGPLARQRDDVEPVAADLGAAAARDVAVGDLDAGGLRHLLGQQGALQGEGGGALAGVEAGVVEGAAGPVREFDGEGQVVPVEALPVAGPADHQQPDHQAPGAQRHHQPGVHAEVVRRLHLRVALVRQVAQLGRSGEQLRHAGAQHPAEGGILGEGDPGAAPEHHLHLGPVLDGGHPELEQRGAAVVPVPGQVVAVGHGLQQDHRREVGQPGHHRTRQLLGDPGRVEQVADPGAELVEQRQPAPGVLDLGHRPVAVGHVHHGAGDAEHLARAVGHPAVRDRAVAGAGGARGGQRDVDDGLTGGQHLALDGGDLIGGALGEGLAGGAADVLLGGEAVHLGQRPVHGGVAQLGVEDRDAERRLLEQRVPDGEIALDGLQRTGLGQGHLEERRTVTVHQQRDPGLHRDLRAVPVPQLAQSAPLPQPQGLLDRRPGLADPVLHGDQLVDPAAHQQLARPAEQLLGRRAPQHHPAGGVEDRDGDLDDVEQAALGVLAQLLGGRGERPREGRGGQAPHGRRGDAADTGGGRGRAAAGLLPRLAGGAAALVGGGGGGAGCRRARGRAAAQARTGGGAASAPGPGGAATARTRGTVHAAAGRAVPRAGTGRTPRPPPGETLGRWFSPAVTRTRHRRGLRLSGCAPRRGRRALGPGTPTRWPTLPHRLSDSASPMVTNAVEQ